MQTEEIRERVIKVTQEALITELEIRDETSFKDDLGADSLALVELVMGFEEEFELTISDEEAAKIQSVGEAIEYIEKALSLKS